MASKYDSIVEIRGYKYGYHCGYCGQERKSSFGMWAHSLTVQDYQDLIDRGWRRSGQYCYQPLMKETCCAQYSIRCEALNFQLTRSQKKVMKRMKHFLNTGEKPKKLRQYPAAGDGSGDIKLEHKLAATGANRTSISAGNVQLPADLSAKTETNVVAAPADGKRAARQPIVEGSDKSDHDLGQSKSVKDVAATEEGLCKKAKVKRIEKAHLRAKLRAEKGLPAIPSKKAASKRKTIEDFLKETSSAKHKLETRLVRANKDDAQFKRTMDESFGVYSKYESTVHSKSHDGQPIILQQWLRFLVSSPFENEEKENKQIGAFHMQYVVDGKIVAVGVIDVLPLCVSSKYFYYDPDFAFLSLGTYSALREIELARTLHRTVPTISYYYLGFYIHTCPKMRYKAKFGPSFLLCPETYTWHPLERCLPLLDVAKYSRFDNTGKTDEKGKVDVNTVLILHKRQALTFEEYAAKAGRHSNRQEVAQYAALVGRTCAQRLLLYRA